MLVFDALRKKFDYILIGSLLPLVGWSLFTLKGTESADDYFFYRQIIWISIGFCLMAVISFINWRVFAGSGVLLGIYAVVLGMLILLLVVGARIKGAASWFSFQIASFQPAEMAKLIVILVLAKYFSRRHIDIARPRHIIISGLYVAVPVGLILLQPDLGSAIIIIALWIGIIMAAGIRLRHFMLLFLMGIVVSASAWFFFLEPYQQQRILTFLNPGADPRGAGYNAEQSMIAVGSGQLIGKGAGYGSQSRLHFLPEAHTDFIFAAFVEEWGFVGLSLLFLFLGIFVRRILFIGALSPANFTKLFAIGYSLLIMVQVTIHTGMNMGVLPVTGITFPFMSYGGSSLMVLFVALGILQNIHAEHYRGSAYSADAASSL